MPLLIGCRAYLTMSFMNMRLYPFLLAILLYAPAVGAQDVGLEGKIWDKDRKSVPDILIRFKNISTGVDLEVRSDGQGYYSVELPVSKYRVRIEENGKKYILKELNLAENSHRNFIIKRGKIEVDSIIPPMPRDCRPIIWGVRPSLQDSINRRLKK